MWRGSGRGAGPAARAWVRPGQTGSSWSSPASVKACQTAGEATTPTVAISTVIAAGLLLPLVLLVLDARSAGWTEIHRVLFRERSWFLLRQTVVLAVLVLLHPSTA